MNHLEQEHPNVVCLSTKNHVLKRITVYIGSINSSAARIDKIFKEVLKREISLLVARTSSLFSH